MKRTAAAISVLCLSLAAACGSSTPAATPGAGATASAGPGVGLGATSPQAGVDYTAPEVTGGGAALPGSIDFTVSFLVSKTKEFEGKTLALRGACSVSKATGVNLLSLTGTSAEGSFSVYAETDKGKVSKGLVSAKLGTVDNSGLGLEGTLTDTELVLGSDGAKNIVVKLSAPCTT